MVSMRPVRKLTRTADAYRDTVVTLYFPEETWHKKLPLQAEALEEQTTKVKRLKEDIQERQGKSRAELEAELAQEAGALSGMQVPCQPALLASLTPHNMYIPCIHSESELIAH
jgi:hypothetical protein